MVKDKNKFNFFVPATFEKGGKDGETMYIKGIASSEVEDTDGETLVPAGYDIVPLLNSGFLNYNHQAVKDPSAIIGEPTKAEIINNGKDLYIEGFLYKKSKLAKSTYELAQTLEENSPNRRMGFSIEGKALERDPLNPKRITKARITGVAITPCPKNPNTLMSIIKGEYSDLWVDATPDVVEVDEEDEDKEKAITAEGSVTQTESVSGGKKVFDALLAKKGLSKKATLKKSEVYGLIFDKYSDLFEDEIDKAKDIFSLIKEFNTKMSKMENTNKSEILSKAIDAAFSFIDAEMEEIQKAKDDKELEFEEDKVEDEDKKDSEESDDKKEDEGKESDDDDVEKGYKEDMSIKETPIADIKYGGIDTYLKNVVKDSLSKGLSESEVIEDLVSKGCDVDFATNLVKGCVEEMNALKANGKIDDDPEVLLPESTHSKLSPDNKFNKSEDGDLELLKSQMFDTFEKAQNRIVEGLESRFTSLATILKSQGDNLKNVIESSTLLKSENTQLKKSIADLNQKLEEYGQQSTGVRSITTSSQAVERFKTNDINKSEDGSRILSLSSMNDVQYLTDKLTTAYADVVRKGNNDPALEKAVMQLAIAKSLDDMSIRGISGTLNDLNIKISN